METGITAYCPRYISKYCVTIFKLMFEHMPLHIYFHYRCVQLWEPDKETLFTKSGESWDMLLTSLRNLLLESFGRQLDSFEDRIRMMREKYANPEWPFIDYFVVHVGSFMFVSRCSFADAL